MYNIIDNVIMLIEDLLHFIKRINWPVIGVILFILLVWVIIIYSVLTRL